MKYLFGPIVSRCLGNILGVDIIPLKTCNFNCLYCELPKTTKNTITRSSFFNYKDIVNEIMNFLNNNSNRIDYILFGGSGEPILNTDIGRIAYIIKQSSKIPIALITNSSLLNDAHIRAELNIFDVVLPGLDAFDEKKFIKLNNPHFSIKFENIINGLIHFTQEFKGKIYLRVMIIKHINDSDRDIIELRRIISKLKIDKLQINTIDKSSLNKSIEPIDNKDKERINRLLGDIVDLDFYFTMHGINRKTDYTHNNKNKVMQLLSKRTLTFEMISGVLKIDMKQLRDIIEELEKEDKIIVKKLDNNFYYRAKYE